MKVQLLSVWPRSVLEAAATTTKIPPAVVFKKEHHYFVLEPNWNQLNQLKISRSHSGGTERLHTIQYALQGTRCHRRKRTSHRCTKVSKKTISVLQKPKQIMIFLHLLSSADDFREWKAIKQQPCKLTDNLKVRQGLVPVGASRGLLVQEPFQSITSYRIHYISHPLNRTGQRTSTNRQDYNNLMQDFKRWSLGTKIHSQAGTKESCQAAAVRRDTKPVSSCLSTSDKKHKSWKSTLKGNTLTSLAFIPNAEQAPTCCTWRIYFPG